jgi:hypothetical protein
MVEVYLNSENTEYSFKSFYPRFLEICKEHKEQGRALAFAFILYDFRNPQIAKVLRDDDYSFSLNAISGQYLTVFSLNYNPEKENLKKLLKEKLDERISHRDKPVTKWLTAADVNPFSLEENSHDLIKKYFGDIKVKFPSVLFFQIEDEKVIDYSLIELDEKDFQLAFQELQGYIISAVDALKLITEEHKGNHQQIFTNLESNVKSVRTKITTVKTFKTITSIAELGGTIMGLK